MLKAFVDGGEGMQALGLLWHQLVGVASMANKVWSSECTDLAYGMLLADEVGVGKTAQVMGFIAFTQLVYQLEQQGKAHPPLLHKYESSWMWCVLIVLYYRWTKLLYG